MDLIDPGNANIYSYILSDILLKQSENSEVLLSYVWTEVLIILVELLYSTVVVRKHFQNPPQ